MPDKNKSANPAPAKDAVFSAGISAYSDISAQKTNTKSGLKFLLPDSADIRITAHAAAAEKDDNVKPLITTGAPLAYSTPKAVQTAVKTAKAVLNAAELWTELYR